MGIIGLLSVVSSVSIGRMGERIPLRTILITSCFLGGICYCIPILAGNVTQFVILVGLTGLFTGSLQTTSNTLVGMAVPRNQQGVAYGIAASATSLGVGAGALAGGSLASVIGFLPMFAIAGIMFIIVGFLSIKLIR
jgi:MFS transporter, DHA1 family, multidrug resistance protein